jgi:hypothetical protein
VSANRLGHCLANFRYEARVLEDANRRIIIGMDLFKLVMSVELDLPAQTLELLDEASFNEVNRPFIDSRLGLAADFISEIVHGCTMKLPHLSATEGKSHDD